MQVREDFGLLLSDLFANLIPVSFEFRPIIVFFVDCIIISSQCGFVRNVPQGRQKGLAMLIKSDGMESMLYDWAPSQRCASASFGKTHMGSI